MPIAMQDGNFTTTHTGFMNSTTNVTANCVSAVITMILQYLMMIPGLNGLCGTTKDQEVGTMATVPGFLAYKAL